MYAYTSHFPACVSIYTYSEFSNAKPHTQNPETQNLQPFQGSGFRILGLGVQHVTVSGFGILAKIIINNTILGGSLL